MVNTAKYQKLLSIVVPVFNEVELIDVFCKRMLNVVDSLDTFSFEIIFVDDGSEDGSYQKLLNMFDPKASIKIIKLSRNFGHQIAITAGIDNAKGDAVVVIDADLQDPPEVITSLIKKWEEGYDVVYGIRKTREGESRMKLLTATLFYRVMKVIIKIDIPVDAGDFRLMSKRAVNSLRKLRERDRFIRGLVSWIGFKQTGVYYDREKRYAGKTKYPYTKMIKFAIDGITSFSGFPLRIATLLGYLTSLSAFFYLCNVFIQKACGNTVHGWATIMIGVLLIGGVQLICLGIIGEYISRIFNEIKQRPIYIIEEMKECKSDGNGNFTGKPIAN